MKPPGSKTEGSSARLPAFVLVLGVLLLIGAKATTVCLLVFTLAQSLCATYPLVSGVLICTTKAALADAIAQKVIERKSEFDKARNLCFLLFGALYVGLFQFFLWNVVFESLWPGSDFRASLWKMLATNFISDPCFFFPTFYSLQEVIMMRTLNPLVVAPRALSKYRRNCFRDWMTTWSIWIPGHYVTYFCVPLHLRLPWVAVASIAYFAILSWNRGSQMKASALDACALSNEDFSPRTPSTTASTCSIINMDKLQGA